MEHLTPLLFVLLLVGCASDQQAVTVDPALRVNLIHPACLLLCWSRISVTREAPKE